MSGGLTGNGSGVGIYRCDTDHRRGEITAVGKSTFPVLSLVVLAEMAEIPLGYELPEGVRWLDHYRELGMPTCSVWHWELTGDGRIETTEENQEKDRDDETSSSYVSCLAVSTKTEVDRCLPLRYSLPEDGVGSLPSLSTLWLC